MGKSQNVPSYQLLLADSVDKLSKILDWPLDYNIYIFEQISLARSKLLQSEIEDITLALNKGKELNKEKITNAINMHERLLYYIRLERKRREKVVLKKFINDKALESKSLEPNSKLEVGVQLSPEEEKHILEYKIRSPNYNMLKDKLKNEIGFRRFALLQCVEYRFEEMLNDDQLVEEFCDCGEFKEFEDAYQSLRKAEEPEQILDMLGTKNIVRVMILLAGQAIITGV